MLFNHGVGIGWKVWLLVESVEFEILLDSVETVIVFLQLSSVAEMESV
jgi:hypothetical protein